MIKTAPIAKELTSNAIKVGEITANSECVAVFKNASFLPGLCFPVLLALAAHEAQATTLSDHTIRPYAGVGISYDSNLLRCSPDSGKGVPDSQLTYCQQLKRHGVKGGKGTFITQLLAGFDMDWKISGQELLIRAAVNENIFENFSTLNYLGWDTLAQWNWQLGNQFKGEIGYGNKRYLASFGQINGSTLSNLIDEEKYFANGGYFFHPDWQIRGGFYRNNWNYGGKDRQVSNNTEDTGEIGLQYQNQNRDMAGVRISLVGGSYPNRQPPNLTVNPDALDNGYTRNKYEFIWDWMTSVKTRFDGQVGYVEQRYDHLSKFNFSGVTARANLKWLPSEKTNILLSGWREFGQAANVNTSFILRQGVGLTPIWNATPKMELRIPASYEQQDYLGPHPQKDNLWLVGLNLLYKPIDFVELNALMQHEERSSTVNTRNYQSESIGLGLKIVF